MWLRDIVKSSKSSTGYYMIDTAMMSETGKYETVACESDRDPDTDDIFGEWADPVLTIEYGSPAEAFKGHREACLSLVDRKVVRDIGDPLRGHIPPNKGLYRLIFVSSDLMRLEQTLAVWNGECFIKWPINSVLLMEDIPEETLDCMKIPMWQISQWYSARLFGLKEGERNVENS